MDAGVKVEGLRQSSSKYSVLHLFIPIYIIRYKERFLTGGSLPPLAPSSFDVEGTIPASPHLSRFLLVFIFQFFFSFSFFPRDKPRQQIFTDGHRGGRSNKCLIVLTILSVLHEFYRVLFLFRQTTIVRSLLLLLFLLFLLLLLPALNSLIKPFRFSLSLSFASNSLWKFVNNTLPYNVFRNRR